MTLAAWDPSQELRALGDVLEPSLEDLYEHAPCGHLTTTASGVIVRVNETLVRWSGFRRDQLVGSSFPALLDRAGQVAYESPFVPILRLAGEIREVPLTLIRADGRPLSILVNATARGAEQRQAFRLAVFDATERRGYERELVAARHAAEVSESRVRVLQTAATRFASAESEDSLAEGLAVTAAAVFDARSTTVMLLDDASGSLRPAGGHRHPLGAPSELDAWRPEAESLHSGDVVTIANVAEAARRFPELAQPLYTARLEAMSTIGLRATDDVVGVLACFFATRRTFAEDELEVMRTLAQLAGQAVQRIRLQRELQHLALYDKLTGLANREMLQFRLVQALAATSRHARPMAVVFVDLDGFKTINDRFGHAAGDMALVEIAGRLRDSVRPSDTIARLGGDEFVIVCEDIGADAAESIAERIRLAINQPLPDVPVDATLTASIGIARHVFTGGPSPSPQDILRRADAAMYASKRSGKDRQTVHE